jgi:D-sedoheptulose 7-phosphate isomerase
MDPLKSIEEVRRAGLAFFEERGQRFRETLDCMGECLRSGHKILVFGNGGSASQAQHFASELVNRFLRERPALAALALTTDTSALTSIANDADYEQVFSRQVEALGSPGDVALGLSTSGNSPNVLKALGKAKEMGLVTVALTGRAGGLLVDLADYLLDVPSDATPRIQEIHLLLLHLMAEDLETNAICGNRPAGGGT